MIDTTTNTVIATIPVGGGSPYDFAINPLTNTIHVPNETGDSFSVINAATNTLIGTFPLGDSPTGAVVIPNTNRVYISLFFPGQVKILDGISNAVIGSIPVVSHAFGLGLNLTTNRLYVAGQLTSTVSVIDLVTDAVIATIPVGNGPDTSYFTAIIDQMDNGGREALLHYLTCL